MKCLLPWSSNDKDEKDLATLGFEMKLPRRNLIPKVVFHAIGNIDHNPFVGKELSSILLDGCPI